MNINLKEKIVNKAYKKNIEKFVWDDYSIKDIELHLLKYYEFDGEVESERQNDFINDLCFATDKSKFIF